MRILAVDDDQITLDVLDLVLSHAGHKGLQTALSGKSALEILRKSDLMFDCLILDIEMPEMNGIELCRAIRAIPEYRNTPILMLTARTDVQSIESAFIEGANDYITKPFDVNAITSRLEVAYRMSEQRANESFSRPFEASAGTPAGEHPFALSDPLNLTPAKPLTDPFSFGNYLSQLARKRIEHSLVFALQIDNIETHFNSCTSEEYVTLLRNTAVALSRVVSSPQSLSAYMGDGVFVCITSERMHHLWPDIEAPIEHALNELQYQQGQNGLSQITLSVGRALRANASKTMRVRTTFDRVIAAMKRRKAVKAEEHTFQPQPMQR